MSKYLTIFLVFFVLSCGDSHSEIEFDKVTNVIEFANGFYKNKDYLVYSDARSIYIKDSKNKLLHRFLMEKDSFYISVAPYKNMTHQCYDHYFSTCTGELKDKSFRVKLYSEVSGQLIKDQSIKTGANGFFDIEVPRNQSLLLEVIAEDGKKASISWETTDRSKTCFTGMKLT